MMVAADILAEPPELCCDRGLFAGQETKTRCRWSSSAANAVPRLPSMSLCGLATLSDDEACNGPGIPNGGASSSSGVVGA